MQPPRILAADFRVIHPKDMDKITPQDNQYILEMLNSIIAFQKHKHPAWDDSLPFYSRIEGLPLHCLEFENPDRNPLKFGPTICHYPPRRSEIRAIALTCKSIGPDPQILDIGCGNGFLGSLLAHEGLRVTGIDDLSWKPPQISKLCDQDCYEFITPLSFENFKKDFDVAFCSWMVPGTNLTKEIITRNPSLIIHVFSKHIQNDGRQETGLKEAFICPAGYHVVGGWKAETPRDFFSGIDSRLTSNPTKVRYVEIWRREDAGPIEFLHPLQFNDKYYWDIEREELNRIRKTIGFKTFSILS